MRKTPDSSSPTQTPTLNSLTPLSWAKRLGFVLIAVGLIVRFGIELPQNTTYPWNNVAFFSGVTLAFIGMAVRPALSFLRRRKTA